jgi:hypothetical protein
MTLSTIGNHRVYRESASACQDERDSRAEQKELKLEMRETVLELHEQNRAEHVAGVSERNETSKETENERDASEEFEYSNERPHECWGGHAHAREGTSDTADAIDEELLIAVIDEDGCRGDAKYRKSDIDAAGGRTKE